MKNQLDRDYGFGSLLRFALPSILMMMFMSLYTVVDGFFVSRFVGDAALASVNIVYPAVSLVLAAGVMLSTGGSAVVARLLGEGDERTARESFTLFTVFGLGIGLVFALLGLTAAEPISRLLGADEALLADCTVYLRILLLTAPAYMLQLVFEQFFVTAGKPGLGLGLIVGAGVANMVLDYIFIVPMGMGVAGAALATSVGYLVPGLAGAAFFASRKHGLRFIRPVWRPRMLLGACGNGASEMVTNLSNALVTFLFNLFMMRLLGSDGVSAITIVLYAQFLLTALYMGFSMGVAPVVSYNYGAENHARLHRIFRACSLFVVLSSVAVTAVSLLAHGAIVGLFSPAGSNVNAIATAGFLRFAPAFLFAGVNIFASAFFTALSDGKTSALISFLRTFGFILLALVTLPPLLGVDGVFMSVPLAEACSCVAAIFFLLRGRKRFHY